MFARVTPTEPALRTARLQPLFLISETTDPFANIACEEALMDAVQPGEYLLFLWQNAHTIVIGRNQNAWKECRVAEFEEDGGTIARRLSGGGAVYHDTGNLNFTFIAADEDYDLAMNMQVICDAVRSFGLEAELSGRNDVTIDGAKFSGNAFYRSSGRRCHHGTLMIDVDTAKLARYLNPDPKKLASKGVDSLRSRVANLSDLCPRITVESLSLALIEALTTACGKPVPSEVSLPESAMLSAHVAASTDGQTARVASPAHIATPAPPFLPARFLSPAQPFPTKRLDEADVQARVARLSAWEWRFGRAIPFTHAFGERYAWGNLDVELVVNRGVIDTARISSDALDAELIAGLASALEGCRYDRASLENRLMGIETETPDQQMMRADCSELICGGFYS